MKVLVAKINEVVAGWVQFFRVGNSSRAFSEIREYMEMKIRTLLTRRKRRRKRSVGWRRWSNEYLYGVLELYWDWHPGHLKTPRHTDESDHNPHRPITLLEKNTGRAV